jgi:hypothetical protein
MEDEDRTYTLDEARALLPEIRAILLQLAVERHVYDRAYARVRRQERAATDGDEAIDPGRDEEAAAEIRARIRSLLDHLDALGVQLRDAEAGLVDIPTRRDGEPAWFCWRLADPELGYWHTTREGFASRRPL